MRNRKLLYVLIPLIIVALILAVGVIYLKLNSSPKKIFEHSINKVFSMLEGSEEHVPTMKGTMNLTASIESENEQIQAISTILEGTSINFDMQADASNLIINESMNVTVNDESLLNAAIVLQDQKGYVYLKDYLDKYLEIPQEYLEYSDLTEYYDKIETLDQNKLMESIREELIKSISGRKFTKEKIQKTNVSKLDLTQEEVFLLIKEILEKLKQNENFNDALGEYKDDVMVVVDDMIADFAESEYAEDSTAIISIYTEGLLNKFVGFSIELKDDEDVALGLMLTRGKNASEFVVYEHYGDEREEHIKVRIEDVKENKNKGTATITMTVDEEQFVVTYNYETQGNKTIFTLSTEIKGINFVISGDAVEEGNNVKGNLVISLQKESMGKISLNCAYNFTYDVEIQKVDTQNAVLIDELSEEDQTTLMTNLQNSTLFQIIEQSGLLDATEGDDYYTEPDEYYSDYDEPQVSYGGYTVKYSIPEEFEASEYSSEDFKMYDDEEYNSINVTINWDSIDSYMSDLEDSYALTSEYYGNQKISEIKTYTVNGKEFKVRTITYNDEYGEYAELYFAYELNDEYCYVVEVKSKNGDLSMAIIEKFLDVTVEKANMFSDINVNVDGPINFDTAI